MYFVWFIGRWAYTQWTLEAGAHLRGSLRYSVLADKTQLKARLIEGICNSWLQSSFVPESVCYRKHGNTKHSHGMRVLIQPISSFLKHFQLAFLSKYYKTYMLLCLGSVYVAVRSFPTPFPGISLTETDSKTASQISTSAKQHPVTYVILFNWCFSNAITV